MPPARKSSVPKEHLVNLLRELGYKFRQKTGRVELWRHPTSKHRVEINIKDYLDPATVRSMLYQCGLDPGKVEDFIGGSRTSETRSRK